MRCRFSLLPGLIVAAALLPTSVLAAGYSPPAQLSVGGPPLVQHAQFWDIGRCRAWRRECADRWGWRTGRWYRCLARHGCDRHRYGDRWDR
jgi:hypothetical protein